MKYIHDSPRWPVLKWNGNSLATTLARFRHKQGLLVGKMNTLGFDLWAEASLSVLISDVVKSSAFEGEVLNVGEVRSSIASRLGLDAGGLPKAGRDVEGVVEMMLDATQHFGALLTRDRLFG